MKRKLLIFSIIMALLTGASGCSKQVKTASNGKVDSKSKKTIVIKYPNTQWYDAVYIADAKGFFAEQGIKIQYVGEIPASQIVPAVAAGKIDFGLRHTPLIAMARAQGSPLKIVAAGAQTVSDEYTHMRYVVKKNSPIKTLSDIGGKKIAINSFGACSEFVTKKYLEEHNIKTPPNYIVLPDAQQEQALEQGLIDVAILHAPYSKKAVNNPDLRELTNDYEIDKGASGMCPYFTTEDYIKKNPDAVKGFVTAVAKAGDWAKNNEAEAEKIIADKIGIKVEDVEPWAYYEHQIIPDSAVKYWIDFLQKDGEIRTGQVKTEDLYTNEFNPYK